MKTFKALSLLLLYPEPDWLAALPGIHAMLADEARLNDDATTRLVPLFDLLHESPLSALQGNYVATFDRNPSHSLHLFAHIHGESRDRGSAMIDLLQEYWKYDFDASTAGLPDHVPLFLEFLSLVPDDKALALLGDAVHALAAIGSKLAANGSPYASVFQVLEAMSPVAAPAHDMDQAMGLFRPSADGFDLPPKPQQQVAAVQMPVSRRPGSTAAAH